MITLVELTAQNCTKIGGFDAALDALPASHATLPAARLAAPAGHTRLMQKLFVQTDGLEIEPKT